jgi:7-carboxy-7-deazaguanine synthase
VFVRLTGCPLRCGYCDTAYAFTGGTVMALDDMARAGSGSGSPRDRDRRRAPGPAGRAAVLSALCDAGFTVSLETSGALDVAGVDPRVIKILDIKTPGSGEVARNRWTNLALCTVRIR